VCFSYLVGGVEAQMSYFLVLCSNSVVILMVVGWCLLSTPGCPLSATDHFLLQPLIFALLSQSSAVVLNHISSLYPTSSLFPSFVQCLLSDL